jgi:hypothetical protein
MMDNVEKDYADRISKEYWNGLDEYDTGETRLSPVFTTKNGLIEQMNTIPPVDGVLKVRNGIIFFAVPNFDGFKLINYVVSLPYDTYKAQ